MKRNIYIFVFYKRGTTTCFNDDNNNNNDNVLLLVLLQLAGEKASRGETKNRMHWKSYFMSSWISYKRKNVIHSTVPTTTRLETSCTKASPFVFHGKRKKSGEIFTFYKPIRHIYKWKDEQNVCMNNQMIYVSIFWYFSCYRFSVSSEKAERSFLLLLPATY